MRTNGKFSEDCNMPTPSLSPPQSLPSEPPTRENRVSSTMWGGTRPKTYEGMTIDREDDDLPKSNRFPRCNQSAPIPLFPTIFLCGRAPALN